jgi:hypothetical protein
LEIPVESDDTLSNEKRLWPFAGWFIPNSTPYDGHQSKVKRRRPWINFLSGLKVEKARERTAWTIRLMVGR